MPDGVSLSLQGRTQQIADELMEALRRRQREWSSADEDNRDVARQRFMNALYAFHSLILPDRIPDGPKVPERADPRDHQSSTG